MGFITLSIHTCKLQFNLLYQAEKPSVCLSVCPSALFGMLPIVNVYFIVSIDGKGAFSLQIKLQRCLIILNLAWLNTTNSVVYVLLESIDLMLLKLS